MTEATAIQYTFTGSLTKNDSKSYHPYTFEVPEGTTNSLCRSAPHSPTGCSQL